MKEIKYLSLKDLNAPYEQDIQHAISEVVSSGWYLQGKRIHDFEEPVSYTHLRAHETGRYQPLLTTSEMACWMSCS